MSLKNLNLRPTRSVAFGVQTYCVPLVRSRPLRHRIYADYNLGFSATPTGLSINPLLIVNTSAFIPNPRTLLLGDRTYRIASDMRTIEFSGNFSTNFNAADGSSGTFRIIDGLGQVMSLDMLEGKLLLVCQFGFATLEPEFDASGFDQQIYARTYSHIIPNTARVLGDTVFFATLDGMCRIRRGNVELLDIAVTLDDRITYLSHVSQNRYMLRINDTVLVFEKFFNSHFFMDQSERKVWTSERFSLSYAANRQFLKQIRINTSAYIDLVIMNESREQRIRVPAGQGTQRINVNLKGEDFRIRLETNAAAVNISELVAVIGFGR